MNIKLAWKVLRAKSYIVATETEAAINIPFVAPLSMSDQFSLLGQQTNLTEFRDRLSELIKEHENVSKELYAKSNAIKNGAKRGK